MNVADLRLRKQEWWIRVGNKQIGPLSIKQLKKNIEFTPDTYVWKKGWKKWEQARNIPQLAEVFKDDPPSVPLHQEHSSKKSAPIEEVETLDFGDDPYLFFLWVILMIVILFYVYNQFQAMHS